MSQLEQSAATFQIGSQSSVECLRAKAAADANVCFDKEVVFQVGSRHEELSIQLDDGGFLCNISGSTFTLDSLIQQQKLDAVFGTSDHRKRAMEGSAIEEHGRKRRRL